MDKTFEKWWKHNQKHLAALGQDHIAEIAFEKGIEIGMARSRNYIADRDICPVEISFANGRVVKLNYEPEIHLYIEEGKKFSIDI